MADNIVKKYLDKDGLKIYTDELKNKVIGIADIGETDGHTVKNYIDDRLNIDNNKTVKSYVEDYVDANAVSDSYIISTITASDEVKQFVKDNAPVSSGISGTEVDNKISANAILYSKAQNLTKDQKELARKNIGAGTGNGTSDITKTDVETIIADYTPTEDSKIYKSVKDTAEEAAASLNAVSYSKQTFNGMLGDDVEALKFQARSNIGAASQFDLVALRSKHASDIELLNEKFVSFDNQLGDTLAYDEADKRNSARNNIGIQVYNLQGVEFTSLLGLAVEAPDNGGINLRWTTDVDVNIPWHENASLDTRLSAKYFCQVTNVYDDKNTPIYHLFPTTARCSINQQGGVTVKVSVLVNNNNRLNKIFCDISVMCVC